MKHRVFVKNPHLKSHASLVKLKRELAMERLTKWLKFRDEFIDHSIIKHGELKCVYCNKINLLRQVDDTDKDLLRSLATIDHVTPLAKGGDEFDYDNLVIACRPCNEKKGDK